MIRTRVAAALVGPIAGIVLAACGSTATVASSTLGPVSENLTLSGPTSGSLTSATSATCAVDAKAEVTRPLTVTIDGKVGAVDTEVVLQIDAYLGPGAYVGQNFPGFVNTFKVTQKGVAVATPGPGVNPVGTFDVANNGTGAVDLTLGPEQLKGNWRCR